LYAGSCGREFISQDEAAALPANTDDLGKTIRLTVPASANVVTSKEADTLTADRQSPELLQAIKKMSAEQEAIRETVEMQNGILRQLIGLQSMAHPVIVQDFRMDFGSMVVFMIKWVIAAIPAFIILFIVMSILASIFSGLLFSAVMR
jgi:hypothetical protein